MNELTGHHMQDPMALLREPVVDPFPPGDTAHQACIIEFPKMLEDRGFAEIKDPGKICQGHLALGKVLEDRNTSVR
jgi:hypothetical protein